MATGPAPNVLNLGVATYVEAPGVTAGGALQLCVAPGSTFQVAFYTQGTTENLSPVAGPYPVVQDLRWVTRQGTTFTSWAVNSPQKPDLDWNWPRISFAIPGSWASGVYVAVVYPVGVNGAPTDALGQAVVAGDPNKLIKPHPAIPADPTTQQVVAWDHGMALFVVRPAAAPVASIAYMVAISTYQAYNNTGPGCFYYPPTNVDRVSLRRPGGGTGSVVMLDERDYYDQTSIRNTFAHWDALFIRWLGTQSVPIACDYYTSFDLDGYLPSQSNFLLTSTGQPAYKLLLAVGHDEYWSRSMRNAVEAYLNAGGNVAIFSGNTSYRPVNFGVPTGTTSRFDPPASPVPAAQKSLMNKTQGVWPDNINEASTIGVTFKTGAGSWLDFNNPRTNAGYNLVVPYPFTGTTLVPTVTTFGANKCLVGYECDGVFAGHTPSNYVVWGTATFAEVPPWNQGGTASLGSYQRNTALPANKGVLFNAATTDWARFLMAPSTYPDAPLVQSMTKNVITQLTSA